MSFITLKSCAWKKKLDPNYEAKPSKSTYVRKTNRPYTTKNTLTPEQKHVKALLSCSKRSAMSRGVPWEISEKDLDIPKTCPYLGVTLTYIRGKGRVPTNISIDRKDSSLGYVAGNVEVISDMANRMKQEATPEQLLVFAHGVLNHLESLKK